MTVDAVVIGAGPNGLVAGNQLADHGWSVLVVEAAPEPGGGVRSGEDVEPGVVHDRCSAFHPLAVVPGSPMAALDLERWGLRWGRPAAVLAHPASDGTCAVVHRDLDRTVAALDASHPGDGAGWADLHARWRAVADPLLRSLFSPFPPVRGAAGLAWSARGELARLARFLVLPARRMAEEAGLGPAGARLLAGSGLHVDLPPDLALSGLYCWLLCMVGQDHGFPAPMGGSGSLTTALVRRLEARGGRVRCASPVDEVVVRGGRAVAVRLGDGTEVAARRAVLADVDAVVLYRHLLRRTPLPGRLLEDLDRFHRDHATVKVDWSLDAPIPWAAPEAAAAGTVHLADGIDHLSAAGALLAQRVVPQRPVVVLGQHAAADPTRQPPGRETAWGYTHVPLHPAGDDGGAIAGTVDGPAAERIADRIEAEVERVAPGFRSLVRRRRVLGPGDLQRHDASLVGGAINGGTAQLHQQLVFRPVPGRGRPETPVRGLYLASSSAHPGGGVHGACGANAARAARWHARLHR